MITSEYFEALKPKNGDWAFIVYDLDEDEAALQFVMPIMHELVDKDVIPNFASATMESKNLGMIFVPADKDTIFKIYETMQDEDITILYDMCEGVVPHVA